MSQLGTCREPASHFFFELILFHVGHLISQSSGLGYSAWLRPSLLGGLRGFQTLLLVQESPDLLSRDYIYFFTCLFISKDVYNSITRSRRLLQQRRDVLGRYMTIQLLKECWSGRRRREADLITFSTKFGK